ncbi:hypothetical protein B0T24DRAFT_681794 [Lasiosphaeria ovina]|uniref:Uncharacterized protein n=1 Tax=Lasiosphaeria ovina TaxID=92902 RepID=A0AAE0K497_9PEZI|nr:hypothetical protein B0T24DRAFT_681794 [Lasiosphaeria ovina]
MEDIPGMVFYLAPFNSNKYAAAIIADPANRDRVCEVPHIDTDGPVLRVGLDQQLKNPPYLVQFGRREHNDVILNNRFSRNDQCYFDFNKDTGELLLHDISEKNDTQLLDIIIGTYQYGRKQEEPGAPQIWKTPRQCVVVLGPDPYNKRDWKWIFRIRDAEFLLIPRTTQGQDEATFTEEKRAFAGQPDPNRTIEGTLQRIFTLGLQSLQSKGLTTTYKSASTITFNPHNTRFKTPLEPDEDDAIRYTKLRPLGGGGQGEVHKVVDMYTGNHHAYKIVALDTTTELEDEEEYEVEKILDHRGEGPQTEYLERLWQRRKYVGTLSNLTNAQAMSAQYHRLKKTPRRGTRR